MTRLPPPALKKVELRYSVIPSSNSKTKRKALGSILPPMAEQISPELFKHLAELAALEFDPKESEYLRRELNNQLKAIEELAAIPIPDGTPLAAHGVPYEAAIRPGLRVDDVTQYPGAVDILAQVPETSAGYVVVPEIPHEDLE